MNSAFSRAGAALIVFALAANAPYLYLIENFGYDDVLREPPDDVLFAFAAGGDALVYAWAAFALCALSFIVVASLTEEALRVGGGKVAGFVGAAGAASALAQAIGLARWVFVVPILANLAAEPSTREGALISYQVLHQFAGVAIGEHIGQTLLALWTAGVAWTIIRSGAAPRVFGWLGFVIAGAWLVGQTELFATVTQTPVLEITPFAFMAWQVWLLLIGLVWLWRGLREPAGA
ncbi:MAG: DUF4386 domain-containing protein [Hyphomonadaceae bacterium]|nr:DUF4386 domain-containing protein [Hyphomonadaceae bacterium]